MWAVVFCTAFGLIWQWDLLSRHFVSAAVGDGADLTGEQHFPDQPLKTVSVVRPKPVRAEPSLSFPGRAQARTQATLFFRVSAPLEQILVNPGDAVKKGDILLTLDPRDYQRQVQMMESKLKSAKAKLLKMKTGARPEDVKILKANLSAAKAELDLAKKQLTRYTALHKSQTVTEQAYDQVQTKVKGLASRVAALESQLARDTKGARKEDIMAAQAGIEELNVGLAIARDHLEDTRLTAPFDGVVTRCIPNVHEMVAAGAPVMMLDDNSVLEIPVDVPETLVRQVLTMKDKGKFTVLFLTTGERAYPAKLTEYTSRADLATGTYEFVFSVSPNPEDMVFPGMTAEIRVAADAQTGRTSGLLLPLHSLMGVSGNTAHVFRVDPKTHKIEQRAVVFEALAGSQDVNVVSGLSSEDLVVDRGGAFIRPGETVKFEISETKGAM